MTFASNKTSNKTYIQSMRIVKLEILLKLYSLTQYFSTRIRTHDSYSVAHLFTFELS